jgi:hypothetical protein
MHEVEQPVERYRKKSRSTEDDFKDPPYSLRYRRVVAHSCFKITFDVFPSRHPDHPFQINLSDASSNKKDLPQQVFCFFEELFRLLLGL